MLLKKMMSSTSPLCLSVPTFSLVPAREILWLPCKGDLGIGPTPKYFPSTKTFELNQFLLHKC